MKFFIRLFPLVFFVVGLGVLIYGARDLYYGLTMNRWPGTSGKVIVSQLARSSKTSRGYNFYAADVQYNYSVSGKDYVSSRVTMRDVEVPRTKYAQSIIDRYPVGAAVKVFYNPSHPELAVLDNKLNIWVFFPVIAGGLFALAGIGMKWFLNKYFSKLDAIIDEANRNSNK